MIDSPVPSEYCLKCDVCCRFPESHSPLAPYFTAEETDRALRYRKGIRPFGEAVSGRIPLIPFPAGISSPGHEEGCICPYFNPADHHCLIYEVRPLDCQLYPYALMSDGNRIVLGVDTKCPFASDPTNDKRIREFSLKLIQILRSATYRETIGSNRELVGPKQDDVIPLHIL